MYKKEPLVSIITPNYNTSKFIGITIESVIKQTYKNWEMIIVDDCSTDDSKDIINKYANNEKRIKTIFLNKNIGQGKARNIATDIAQGRFITFLDSDDIWLPDKLQKHINFMLGNGISFSHSSYGYINEEGNEILKPLIVSKHPITYQNLLKRTEISCLTAIYDCSLIGKFYMPDLRRKQDYALWLTILKTGVVSIPLDEVLAFYRQRDESATTNKNKFIVFLNHYNFLRIQEKLSIIKSIYYTFHWAINGLIRYGFNK